MFTQIYAKKCDLTHRKVIFIDYYHPLSKIIELQRFSEFLLHQHKADVAR